MYLTGRTLLKFGQSQHNNKVMLTILSLLLLLPYGYGHKSDEQLKTIAEQAYGIHLEPVPSGAFKEYVVLAAQNDDKFGRNIFCKRKLK